MCSVIPSSQLFKTLKITNGIKLYLVNVKKISIIVFCTIYQLVVSIDKNERLKG